MAIPNRVRDRMIAGLKRLVPIIHQLKARDVGRWEG